ncbi:cytochrome P450 [Burkholderia sola]|uniref:cytochrome P450 n=1 Tax=Burkholderia sola TaxID=2843302 RepID=UPI00338DD656
MHEIQCCCTLGGTMHQSGLSSAKDKVHAHSTSANSRTLASIQAGIEDLVQKLVGRRPTGLADSLADLGLDSIGRLSLASQIETIFAVSLPSTLLQNATSLADVAALVLQQTSIATDRPLPTRYVALREWTVPAPVFCIGGAGGSVGYLGQLDAALGSGRPFVALQAPGIDRDDAPLGSIEELATWYLRTLRALQPVGPYLLAGHSFGGVVAYEMAQQLTACGEIVAALLLIDTPWVEYNGPASCPESDLIRYELETLRKRLGEPTMNWPAIGVVRLAAVYQTNIRALERYEPKHYGGPVTVFRAQDGFPPDAMHPARHLHLTFDTSLPGWNTVCPDLRVIEVPGDHFTVVLEPNVQVLARSMHHVLEIQATFKIALDRLRPIHRPAPSDRAFESKPNPVLRVYHPDFIRDPYPFLHQLRALNPVHYDQSSGWWLTRYDDVVSALKDRRLSADPAKLAAINSHSGTPTWCAHQQMQPLAKVYNSFMLFQDPPRHELLRRLFMPALAVNRWESYIDTLVNELLDAIRNRPVADLVQDFAQPLTVRVASAVLGLPSEDADQLLAWGRDLALGLDLAVTPEEMQRVNRSAEAWLDYLQQTMTSWHNDRSAAPEWLTTVLDPDELAAAYAMVFMAAFETTLSMVGNSALALSAHPTQLEHLRKTPALVDNAVEELLRFDGAIRCGLRCATEDFEIGERPIAQGDLVLLMFCAANRDPARFPHPDRLDFTRPNARHHVAFSHGLHYCLGAQLARLELRSVVRALSQRPYSVVSTSDGPAWRHSAVFRTLTQLSVAWHKSSASAAE